MRIFFKILLFVFTVGDVYSSTAVAPLHESQRWSFASTDSHTAFNKVKAITETQNGSNDHLDITYGPDYERVKTELKQNGNIIKTVIFAGNYERITKGSTTQHLYYIASGEGLCAIVLKQDGQPTPTYY